MEKPPIDASHIVHITYKIEGDLLVRRIYFIDEDDHLTNFDDEGEMLSFEEIQQDAARFIPVEKYISIRNDEFVMFTILT